MTERDRIEFAALLAAMEIATGVLPDAARLPVYFDDLQGWPLEIVRQAAKRIRAQKHFRFPASAAWLEECRVVLRGRDGTIRTEPWRHDCDGCEDIGWQIRKCESGHRCGRARCQEIELQKPDWWHDYAERCPCQPTNPTYQRHHR